jgi:hypothetical protein
MEIIVNDHSVTKGSREMLRQRLAHLASVTETRMVSRARD